ncbi:hypothetical protein P1J78_12830 [Psychromarinibacter sp. C21-152]|uniref:Uncharacterized protein n=1 Tax=Psychromarinibacter sediminicola TaxID=3033385 RepID=A0AAE3NVX6_9RHOB|nr:hypothetical protein [Psychromarinibacter sediminicola]MDF0601622.1 hypothetical protein [Psychromarinibacter sediminicola]
MPDEENPPFDFASARAWRPGDPPSSPEARLYRALRQVVAARKSGQEKELTEALDAAESVLSRYEDKG